MLRRSITCLLAVGAVSALLTLSPPKALALPTLQIEGGILMGATGVDVGGTLYNVRFVDGTCQSVYSNCDEPADFVFTTLATADAASTALMEQIFLDINGHPFDTIPYLTAGCQSGVSCIALTPYGFPIHPTIVSASMAQNDYLVNDPQVSPLSHLITTDLTSYHAQMWADWSLAPQTVPEPSSVFLLVSGLVGLAGYGWRQRPHAGLQIG